MLLAVIALLSSIAGNIGENRLMDASAEITENYSASIQYASGIMSNFQSMRRIIYAHCLAEDSTNMNSLETEFEELKNSNSELIALFREQLDPGEETETFEAFESEYEDFLEVMAEAIRYSSGNQDEVAANLANGDITEIGSQIATQINDMIDSNEEGMDEAVAQETRTYNSVKTLSNVLFVFLIVCVALAIIIVLFEICSPLLRTNKKLREIVSGIEQRKGDLTQRVPVFRKDEIGSMAIEINELLERLQKIMLSITDTSKRMEGIVGTVSQNVTTANVSSMDVSSVMEELSASMEEVASSVSDVNANTVDVDSHVVELAEDAERVKNYTDGMQKRAHDLEQMAVGNKQNASNVINEILVTLKQAIEDSKSVDRVNDLTDEILNISSQTNLLALNASIEAARAGDAGKGFAVVADEIRQLADSSREAANKIQTINNMVVAAVKQLISSSDTIIDYINENVLPDYDNFVDSGKQYREDATYVNEVVVRFSEMSAQLRELVQSITESMDGISAAVEESANGVSNAALSTTDLVKDINQISDEMKNNNEVTGILKQQTEIFSKL
jgi:methyl-accepting chemotaxis protein